MAQNGEGACSGTHSKLAEDSNLSLLDSSFCDTVFTLSRDCYSHFTNGAAEASPIGLTEGLQGAARGWWTAQPLTLRI